MWGPKRFRNHSAHTKLPLYLGFYAYFHQKMQDFAYVRAITWKVHSQSKNDKIQFFKFSQDYKQLSLFIR